MFVFGNSRPVFPWVLKSASGSVANLLLVAVLALLVNRGASAGTVELTPPERAAVLTDLQQLRAKYPTMESDFTEEKTSHLLSRPLLTEGIIAFQAPDKFRREVKGNSPSLTVSNGKTLWIYYPAFKTAELYTLGQRAIFDDSVSALTAGLNFAHLDEFYTFRAFREDAGHRFILTPKRPSLRRILLQLTVWMDAEYKAQKTEIILPKGDRVVTNYKNARRASLPSGTFEFTPPPDVEVTRPLGK